MRVSMILLMSLAFIPACVSGGGGSGSSGSSQNRSLMMMPGYNYKDQQSMMMHGFRFIMDC